MKTPIILFVTLGIVILRGGTTDQREEGDYNRTQQAAPTNDLESYDVSTEPAMSVHVARRRCSCHGVTRELTGRDWTCRSECYVSRRVGVFESTIARRSVDRNLTGLEWAAAVPGTVGGAVVNNAGAMGGDTAGSLEAAEVLQQAGEPGLWTADRFKYAYRNSVLKSNPGMGVVLRAAYRLQEGAPEMVQQKMDDAVEHRRRTQPAGASWGSMFKNPSGDFAGRLIEASGLKGLKQGGVEVSTLHANFFLNQEEASAADVARLIRIVREKVKQDSGVGLDLEVEFFGDWPAEESGKAEEA